MEFNKQLEEIQINLNKLSDILREQKEECKKMLDKKEEENNEKIDYKNNIEKYVKYSKMNNDVDLIIFENKEKKRILKEKINHSKTIIDEYHKKKYNKLIMDNLENYLKL